MTEIQNSKQRRHGQARILFNRRERRGTQRNLLGFGVSPHGWRASPPSINLRRASFGLAKGGSSLVACDSFEEMQKSSRGAKCNCPKDCGNFFNEQIVVVSGYLNPKFLCPKWPTTEFGTLTAKWGELWAPLVSRLSVLFTF